MPSVIQNETDWDHMMQTCGAAIITWLCQVRALCWKEAMRAVRYPCYSIAQIIAPAIIIAILGYGAGVAPKIYVPGYFYKGPGVLDSSYNPPPTGDFAGTAATLASTLDSATNTLAAGLTSTYVQDQTLPAYISATNDPRRDDSQFTAVNVPAASPYIVPSLSSYLTQREAERRRIGRLGIKAHGDTNDYIWHLFQKGQLVFTPNSAHVDELVNYLLNTSGPLLQETILPYTPTAFATKSNYGFPNLGSINYQKTWAIVSVNDLGIDPINKQMTIDYTIMLNQTIVPATDRVSEPFPRGLGKNYAKYSYSGYTVLQRAINKFAARKTRQVAEVNGMVSPTAGSLSAVDLALAACPNNGKFVQPTGAQSTVLEALLATGPSIAKTTIPTEEPSVNALCLVEMKMACEDYQNEENLTTCLNAYSEKSQNCAYALQFVSTNKVANMSCLEASYTCDGNITVEQFLTGLQTSTSLAKCFSFTGECATSNFAALYADVTAGPDVCASDVNQYCASYKDGSKCSWVPGSSCKGPLQCLQDQIKAGKTLTPKCGLLVDAVSYCSDDLNTICPWATTASLSSFPALCLHMNRDYMSSACFERSYRANVLEPLYGNDVTIVTVDRATATCRTGIDLEAAFQDSVASVAMPTNDYIQQPFFENLGPLVGLIVAVAFTVPFCALVRRIVEDRFLNRRTYLLLIGGHHSAIIFADGFIGFLFLFLSAFVSLLGLADFLFDSSKLMLFGILVTYAMALSSFGTFVAAIFNNPRTANSVAPMLLFLTALPAYVTVVDLDIFTNLLPASVVANTFNLVIQFSLTTSQRDYGYLISSNCGILFAHCLMYSLFTMILEYARYSKHGFGCFHNVLYNIKYLMSNSTRVAFRPLRKTAVYRQLSGQDYTGTRRRMEIREDDMNEDDDQMNARNGEEFNESGSVPLTDTNTVETPMGNRGDYSIGGVAAAADLSTAAEDDSNEVHQHRSPTTATRFVDLSDVSYTTTRVHHGRITATKDVSASLYRNRINVIIGPGGSGKSSLMDVLTGKTAPTSGTCLIDDVEARFYNHRRVGVCPQSNTTWDKLSVMEHLEFLQAMKGVHNNETAISERLALCEALQLDSSDSLHVNALPPGVLRRLSVAMAFVGGSRYIVLDEPTTEVDENGRRCMWRLFNENAVGRCLVISTTNVEEAEAAEHVLLMHRGTLKASGSPQFLKKHLGGGAMIVSIARGQHCNVSSIISRVRACCPGTQLVNNVGQELSFRIAPTDFHSVPDLIADLELAANDNDIVSISVADARLDELFMVCVREFDATEGTAIPGSDGRFDESVSLDSNPLEGETSGGSGTNARSDYVTHESMTNGLARAVPTPGTSTRHVKASSSVPVDPSWFRTASVVGNDQERRHRRHGFELIYRNTLSVIIQRLNGSLSELLATILEFILPLFCIVYAVTIATLPVADPPSLLLTPNMFRYSKNFFCAPDAEFRSWLNGQTYNGFMTPGESWFRLPGSYVFAKAPNDNYDAISMEGSFEISYDLHETAQFMGGYAFEDSYMTVKDPTTNQTKPWHANIVFQNTSTAHSLPIYINVYDSLRTMRMTNFTMARIWGRSDPFAAGTTARMAESKAIYAIIGTLLILVPFTFLPGIFALQVVGERQSGVLAALSASRLSPVSYWLGTFVWHMLRYILFATSALVCMSLGGGESLLGADGSTVEAFGLLFLYGCCSIAMAYGISRAFSDALSAQTFITLVNFICGVVCVVSINAIDIMSDTHNGEADYAKSDLNRRRRLFRIVPSYALGEGLLKITSASFYSSSADGADWLKYKSPTLMYQVLGFTFPFYLLALIAFDGVFRLWCIRLTWYCYSLLRDSCLMSFSSCVRTNTPVGVSGDPLKREPWFFDDARARQGEDASVEAERQKGPCPDGLTVQQLWRKYVGFGAEHNVYAVKGATLTVGPGDRLVVFGSNGSGKTTLINMMAGLLMPSHGTVEIKSRLLQRSSLSQWRARSFTGYSGSEAGVLPSATPYMLLNLLADYRGMVPDGIREGHIGHLLHTLGLLPLYATPIALLSPSLRRRVSVAMAIVGFPPVILLDEPTAGMDPVGRRMTWAALNLVPSKCAVVLSTHSVADVEMIANRVCLLQKGRVAFINEAQVAKQNANVKGMFVHIHINVKGSSSSRGAGFSGDNDLRVKTDVMEFMMRAFPGSVLLEDRNNVDLKFHVCAEEVSDSVFRQTNGPQTFGRGGTSISVASSAPQPAAAQSPTRDLLDTGREEEPGTEGSPTEGHAASRSGPMTSMLSPNFLIPSHAPQLPQAPKDITMREVFERLHQKRVELMIQGIYGDPISGPTSPTTKVNRSVQQQVVFQSGGGRPSAASSTPERTAEDRHREEIRDLLGGGPEPRVPTPPPAPRHTETPTAATEEPASETNRIMPFDIVITKSTIDLVLDKLIGVKGESAALERMFQNTSARISVQD